MLDKGNQTQKDWGEADFGLLNNDSTKQQEVGRKYLKDVMEKGEYSSYTGTGHSLGDNLITDSYLYLPKAYRDKMTVYGFDGPNFSEEYVNELKSYYDEQGWSLENATGNITHYQWSLVGAMFLGNLPGINLKIVQTTDDVYGNIGFSALTQKHAVVNLKFDEDGNLIDDEMDPLAKFVAVLTNGIDAGTHTKILPSIIVAVLGASKGEKMALATGVIALVSVLGIGATLAGALGIIIGFSKLGILDMFYDSVISRFLEKIESDVKGAIDRFISDIEEMVKKTFEFLNTAKETISKILNSVKGVLNKLQDWLFKNSSGYKYASTNPYIVIDTDKMKSYAGQLSALSSRSKTLDRRMNSLYFHAGFDWNAVRSVATLGSLLKAEVVLDFAGRLDKCASYLNETASDFEKVEVDIVGMI